MASIVEERPVEEAPAEEASAKAVPAGEARAGEEAAEEQAFCEAQGEQVGSPQRVAPPTGRDASPEQLDRDDVQSPISQTVETSRSQCPSGHRLEIARAPAGQCDGCGGRVADRQIVSACVDCNWYLCTTCRPIPHCPSSHPLCASVAAAGTCDGCRRGVSQGETVSACRDCNWYLCTSCQPCEDPWTGRVGSSESLNAANGSLPQCPSGHELKTAKARAGQCDGCGGRVASGQIVSECTECNFYLCTTCRPCQQCPSAHRLHVAAAVAGTCDGCQRRVKLGEIVSDCRICDWYLCMSCQPLEKQSESPVGISLSSQRAGTCALCRRPTTQEDMTISSNGHVWHICETCAAGKQGIGALASRAETTQDCAKGHKLEARPAVAGA